MAKRGEFDILIPRELDRLSRNLAKQLIVEEELRRHGVEIDYALAEYPDTPEGRLNKHIRATIAEYEREKIVERMTRGTRNAVKNGSVIVGGNPPYGYRLERDGNRFVLVVYEPEARIVRLVYTWYTVGDGENGPLSIYAITQKLNNLGIPTYAETHGRYKKREVGKWGKTTVHQMLKRETYIGHWYYGKMRRIGNRKWERNADGHKLAVDVPAIVDLKTWEAAQKRATANKANARRNRKYDYLLAGRVTCGTCKLKMSGQTSTAKGQKYGYYRCPATQANTDNARTCNAPSFPADLVDAGAWNWIQELLTDPEALRLGLEKHKAEKDKENAPIRARLEVVDDLLTDNRKQLDRLLDLYLSGDFPKETLIDRKARLEKTILGLEKERGDLVAQLEAGELTEEQVQTLTDFVAEVGVGIDVANADFQTRRAVVEALDARAVLFVQDGEKRVRVGCNLGQEKEYNLCPIQPGV